MIHASLPLVFSLVGMESLAEACRALGGHLFGDPVPFSAFTGVTALVVAAQGWRGVAKVVKANSDLRRNAAGQEATPIAGSLAAFLPLRHRWAVAIPGGTPPIVLSSALVGTLEHQELGAVVRHEMAHLDHHHVRFLLLGAAVTSGLWFLPWSRRANESLGSRWNAGLTSSPRPDRAMREHTCDRR